MKFWLQSCLASRGVAERGRAWRNSTVSGCAALEVNTNFNNARNGGSSGSLKGLRVSAIVNTIWILSKMKHICSFGGILGAFSTAQCPALFAVLNTYGSLSSKLLSGDLD